jgi:hypothetical protein
VELEVDLRGAPLAAGTVTIVPGGSTSPIPSAGQGTALFGSVADCAGGASEYSSSGTVVVQTIDAEHVVGTVDVTFGDGHLTGSFDAPICAIDAEAIQNDCP